MSKVISLRDVQDMISHGQDVTHLPADAIITPSANDYLYELQMNGSTKAAAATPAAASGEKFSPPAKLLNSKSPKSELEAFFNSPYVHNLKEQICDMGHRLWQRAYVDGNGGNMSIRIGEDIVLCTPTLVSKGSLTPADMCLVDFEGNQLCGTKKRTSEVLMHLQMMKHQPQAKAVCHCHPPYATAFAAIGIAPPTCMLPEYEVFCAVAVAPYRTPGSAEMGEVVSKLTDQYNTILMANHGVVTWSHNSIEEAYWRMEILEAYCRTIVVAGQLGKPINTFTGPQMHDLLKTKKNLGFVDPRYGMKECELCDSGEWRPGAVGQTPQPAAPTASFDPEAEAAVKAITDQILARMK
jgi:L-fuculose-phosphate aldolase